jgi:hypothetical protein
VHWPLWPAPFPPFVGGCGFPNAAGAATAAANALARKTHASFLRICSPPPLWVGVRAPERVSLLRKRAPRWSESYTRSLGTTSLFRRLSRAVGNRGRCNGPAPRASVGWGFLVPWTSGAEIKNVIRPPSPGGRWLPIRTYGVLLLVHTERGRCRKFRSKRSQVAIFLPARSAQDIRAVAEQKERSRALLASRYGRLAARLRKVSTSPPNANRRTMRTKRSLATVGAASEILSTRSA